MRRAALAVSVALLPLLLAAIAAAQGPPLPHTLFGNATAEPAGGPAPGVPVLVTNLRTGGSGRSATDSLGFWQFDLSELPGGFRPGDPLEVRAGERTVRTSVSGEATQGLENLSVPPAAREAPSPVPAGEGRAPAGDPGLSVGVLLLLPPAALVLLFLLRKRKR